MKSSMRVLLSVLALAATANAEFKCGGECAMKFYEYIAAKKLSDHGMKDVDAAVYAYMIYENYSATATAAGQYLDGNVNLVEAFTKGIGTECKLGADWTRDQVVKCFEAFDCEKVDDAKASFKECNDANDKGCNRLFGLFLAQFNGPSCYTKEFPSELTEAQKINGVKVYKVFMGVMENWNSMGAECQKVITDAAGYKEGDDVVLTIADKADEIIKGVKVAACGYADGKFDDTAVGQAAKKAEAATVSAKAEVAKLETQIKAEAGSAYSLSFAAAAVAALLL